MKWLNLWGFMICLGLGILVPFYSHKWHLADLEIIIYSSFLITFSLSFLLFSFPLGKEMREYRLWMRLANLSCFVLLILLLYSFHNRLQKSNHWMVNPSEIRAKIYKIDPEGFRKKRMVYYVFQHDKRLIIGSGEDPNRLYGIGDSVAILYSTSNPKQNIIIRR